MKNELLSIGPFTVYGYGLMIGIGIIAAYLLAEYRAKKKEMNAEVLLGLTIWCVLGGFLGSKLLYALTKIQDIIKDPSAIGDLASGWVVYGGIIGGVLVAIIFCKIKKLDFLKYFDLVIPSVALAQGFGRIGCIFAGCCYGRETDSHFGMVFHESAYAPNGIALVPTQAISSILNFLHFFLLLFLSRKFKTPGRVGASYIILYSIGRFILEFYRGDLERGSVGTFSTSQFISIFTVIAGILLFVFTGLMKKKESTEEMVSHE